MVDLTKFQLNTAITYLGVLTNTFTGWWSVKSVSWTTPCTQGIIILSVVLIVKSKLYEWIFEFNRALSLCLRSIHSSDVRKTFSIKKNPVQIVLLLLPLISTKNASIPLGHTCVIASINSFSRAAVIIFGRSSVKKILNV